MSKKQTIDSLFLKEQSKRATNYSAKALSSLTGLSLSTVYRRQRQGLSQEEIIAEAKLMQKHKNAGSNWKKVVQKEVAEDPKQKFESIILKFDENDLTPKERKRIVVWEPADDYGIIKRLKVLGGWIVKVENEVLFVMDPKHKWEV